MWARVGEYFLFEGGFKDYVRVENRLQEAKYLKNTKIGDEIDLLISEVNHDDFFIKGSLSELY
jgi:hypothetical protein